MKPPKPYTEEELLKGDPEPHDYLVVIPDNKYGILSGYYTWQLLVNLLRYYKDSPDAVQFIADMME